MPDTKLGELSPLTKDRAIAVVFLLFPVLLGLFAALPWFFLVTPIALAIVVHLEPRLQWPHVRTTCIAGVAILPVASLVVFPGMPWQGFAMFAASSAIALVAIFYGARIVKSLKAQASAKPATAGPEAAPFTDGADTEASPGSASEEFPASDAAGAIIGKPPLIATTTERRTPEGIEYTVTWTDFAKLSFWDRHHLLLGLPVMTVMVFIYGATLWGDTGKLFTVFGVVLAAASVGIWIYKFYHERDRRSVRSIVIQPGGSILLRNPPSYDANRETDGQSMAIANGLGRLTSIEYTKTAEWLWIMPQCVRSVEHWYEVHFLFGEEWRVSVSRSLGSRDHAHQITGHLNRLKAKLTRPQAAPAPAERRVLD